MTTDDIAAGSGGAVERGLIDAVAIAPPNWSAWFPVNVELMMPRSPCALGRAMLTMVPEPCSSMRGSAARQPSARRNPARSATSNASGAASRASFIFTTSAISAS